MSSCSLNSFKDRFPEVGDSDIIDFHGKSNKNEIIAWVNKANAIANAQGFNVPLYEILEKQIPTRRPGKFISKPFLVIHKENLNLYQKFIDTDLKEENDFREAAKTEVNMNLMDAGIISHRTIINEEKENLYEGDVLGAPENTPEAFDFDDMPDVGSMALEESSFTIWKEHRVKTLNRLMHNKQKLLAQNASSELLKDANLAIRMVKSDIARLDVESDESTFESISLELRSLHRTIKKAADPDTDPVVAANLLETNSVLKRLDYLKKALATENDPGIPVTGELAILFGSVSGEFDQPAKLAELKSQLGVTEDYRKFAMQKIVERIILNSDYLLDVKELARKSNDAKRIQDYENLEKKIAELLNDPAKLDSDDGKFSNNLLGARSYDNILAEIVVITSYANLTREIGVNNVNKKKLQTAYNNLVQIRTDDGGYFIDKFWEKDEFGQNTDQLISPFTSLFQSMLKKSKKDFREFELAEGNFQDRSEIYEEWMEKTKKQFDVIIPYNIPSIHKRFANEPLFSKFFDNYDESSAKEYEEELIDMLGPTAYAAELRKLEKQLENFTADGYLSEDEFTLNNPMEFTQHFYSDNYKNTLQDLGDYVLPTHVSFIPKNVLDKNGNKVNPDLMVNKDFKKIEEQGGVDFKNFYESASEILNYTKDAFSSVGQKSDALSILNLEDSLGRAAMAELKTLGKAYSTTAAMIKAVGAPFVQGENVSGDKEGINTKASSYGAGAYKKYKILYEQKSLEELIDIAKKEKLTLPNNFLGPLKNIPEIDTSDMTSDEALLAQEAKINREKNVAAGLKRRLIDAIARSKVNKSSSLNMFERISYTASAAESVSARNQTMNTIQIIQSFIADKDMKNVGEYLDTWTKVNIQKHGYLMGKGKGEGKEGSRWNNTSLGLKQYSSIEKEIKADYEMEIKRFREVEYFDFTHNGIRYSTNSKDHPDGLYSITHLMEDGEADPNKPSRTMTLIEMQDAYKKFLEEQVSQLGNQMTSGTLAMGLGAAMYKSSLLFKAPSGYKNRAQGKMQNDQAAASGQYGFNSDDLSVARAFLFGVGTRKFISAGSRAVRLTTKKRVEQQDTLKQLAENLGIVANVMRESGTTDGGPVANNWMDWVAEKAGDLPMNVPEYKNQMELFIALLQNSDYIIEGIDPVTGEKISRPFFDAKTMTLPYKPGTLELLDEYRTEDNIKNWEQFTKNSQGFSPQNVLLQQYTQIKNKLQGNYESEDKIALQKSMLGKASTGFIKWAFENLDNQYGSQKISLTTAKVDVRGRKIVLGQNFPLLTTHLFLNNVGLISVGGSVYAAIQGAGTSAAISSALSGVGLGMGFLGAIPFIPAGVAVGTSAWLLWKARKMSKSSLFAKEDAGLALKYLMEIVLRTVKRTATGITLNHSAVRNNIYKDNTINEWLGLTEEKFKNKRMTLEERKVISANAMELADKMSYYIQFNMGIYAIKGLAYAMALMAVGEGEEEEKQKEKEKYLRLMKMAEGNINKLMNIQNELTADSEKWTNPVLFKDDLVKIPLIGYLDRSFNTLSKDYTGFGDGNADATDIALATGEFASQMTGAVPSAFWEAFRLAVGRSKDNNLLQNDRVFAGKDVVEDWITSSGDTKTKSNDYYKKISQASVNRWELETKRVLKYNLKRYFDSSEAYENFEKAKLNELRTEFNLKMKKDRNYEKFHNTVDFGIINENIAARAKKMAEQQKEIQNKKKSKEKDK